MRKLSVVMAALFLFGSTPAFAQASGGTESGTDGGSETGAKKSSKKAKKGAKKKKAASDAGM